MKALEQNKSFNKNDAVTYHVVDVAGRRSMAEDILGECISRGIGAPGRAGWPTGHVGQLRWPCRSPFAGLAAAGWAKPTPCWHAGFNIRRSLTKFN